MRIGLLSVCLVLSLSLTIPATAQLRTANAVESQSSAMYENGGGNALFNAVFSPQYFSMGHSFEFTAGGGSGYSSSLAMYTNSLMWDFGDKLSARADVSVAYSPFASSSAFGNASSYSNGAKVFLRNAEVAYSPGDNVQFRVSVNTSPYGYHASPYGYYRYR